MKTAAHTRHGHGVLATTTERTPHNPLLLVLRALRFLGTVQPSHTGGSAEDVIGDVIADSRRRILPQKLIEGVERRLLIATDAFEQFLVGTNDVLICIRTRHDGSPSIDGQGGCHKAGVTRQCPAEVIFPGGVGGLLTLPVDVPVYVRLRHADRWRPSIACTARRQLQGERVDDTQAGGEGKDVDSRHRLR